MEVDRRVYVGGNITFFDPPPKNLIHYYISTMIHLYYGGGSYSVRRREHFIFCSTSKKKNTLLYYVVCTYCRLKYVRILHFVARSNGTGKSAKQQATTPPAAQQAGLRPTKGECRPLRPAGLL
jgi:hypothetical protein